MSETSQLVAEMRAVWASADERCGGKAGDRDLTGAEYTRVRDLLSRIKALKENNSMEPNVPPVDLDGVFTDPRARAANAGPGDIFVKSVEYQKIRDSATRGQTWTTGPIQVSNVALSAKGTLTETTGGGPGGGLIPPFYQPGVVDKLFEPLGVADVFGSSQVTASQVRYVVEGTATSGAAGVAETAAKPESSLGYSETTEAIRKIATVLPVSDEFLEDAPSIQQYLNNRLSLFVKIEEERQLLRGAGSGSNELLGIFGRAGINQFTKPAGDNNAEAIARTIANTAGSAYVQPDTVILHPTNWLSTRLLRAGTAGEFFGGGPFGAAYGGNSPGLFGGAIWGTRVVLSSVVGPGTALVGNFGQSAHIWRRGGVTVEATNSHSDYFVKNLSMLRAEERLGLGVFRPGAFTELRGLT